MYIENLLSSLTEKEQKQLKSTFKRVFFFSGMPYTIFGSKPLSFEIILPTDEEKKGVDAWQKIEKKFSSKKHLVRKVSNQNRSYFLAANIPEIENVYADNEKLFKEKSLSLEELKRQILKQPSLLLKTLEKDHLLLGILLGYGTHNASVFSKNRKLPKESRKILTAFTPKYAILYYFFSPCLPPCFACDLNAVETALLKEKYAVDRKRILQISKEADLFDWMLLTLGDKR